MSDSLFNILSKKDFSEPAEVTGIKRYISEHFQVEPEVMARDFDIVITVPSAALASVLRFHVRKLQEAGKTKKRLVLRIR